jgi:transcription elongation factor Elf1
MTLRVFRCPFCGYRFRADPEERYQRSVVWLVRGEVKPRPPRTQDRDTVDLICPNCEQHFEVEVEV